MKKERRRAKWVGPEYGIRVSFQVPLDFAFAWCTDFTSEDPKLERATYKRKIVERTPGHVVFEDLEETKDGWNWSRNAVTLRPPNRWHMDGFGNHRDMTADYLLTGLSDGRTQLDLRWRRQPKDASAAKLTKAQREADSVRAWKQFALVMEKDYKQSKRRRGN